MKWPLSMSFAKLTSRTADAGQARYTLPGPGLLNPDRTYFWRVRAQDDKGVWGTWSETWSFVPRGPAPPLDVTLQFDSARTRGVLRWSPNPKGRKPVAYRVYASDEKGFSVSDQPYAVTVGDIQARARRVPRELRGRDSLPPSWRWWAPMWSSPARTRRSTESSRWTRRASGAVLPTTPPRSGRSSSASP